jgi:dipeptidyl aminopeptidase/acylaminoacyl peptidase
VRCGRLAGALATAFFFLAQPAHAAPPPHAPPPHPYGIDDWQRLRSAAPVAVAPDGKTILYSVAFGQAKGPTKTEWYTIGASGSGRKKLTLPKDFQPIGFTTSVHELYGTQGTAAVDQLARWTIGSKKSRIISRVPGGVSGARISPDGSRFALLGDPQPPDPLAKVRTVVENDRSALYVVAADGRNGSWWCAGHDRIADYAWSGDGARIAILEPTPKLGYHAVSVAVEICSPGSVKLVAAIPTAAAGLAWTDAGATLAYLSTTTDVLTPDHLWTVSASGGTPVDRTPDIAYSILGLRGDAHGRVWAAIAAGVQSNAAEYAGGAFVRTFSNGSTAGMPVTTELKAAPELLAFPLASPVHPSEVAVAGATGLRTITHESDAQLANISLGKVLRHQWTSADGTKLEAIVTFPPNWSGKPGKFLVLPHGGPEANDRLVLDASTRIIASRGFVVMQPEYRGSTGYGSAHLQAIYQRFGDTAYRDVDAATTEAVAQGWADPARLAIFGWSAGGFMTAWTVTQTPRYKAAIEGAGITEWLSFIPTSDVQQTDYDARELNAGAEPFLKYSAVMFSKNVTTPLLILHGESDVRVPTYQGRELFVLLREEGKTVRMVTYPGSPHFPRLWEQRRNVFAEVLGWLDRYVI